MGAEWAKERLLQENIVHIDFTTFMAEQCNNLAFLSASMGPVHKLPKKEAWKSGSSVISQTTSLSLVLCELQSLLEDKV